MQSVRVPAGDSWRACPGNATKQLRGAFIVQARRQLIRNSIHLECEVLQFALALDLKDDRIPRSEIVDQGLEL